MNILAIGAHPDDIEFGCGGTLYKLSRHKNKIYLFVATEGEIGAPRGIRKKEQLIAAKYLKAKDIFWGEFVDTRVPTGKELINKIEKTVKKTKADLVFVNYFDDVHQDHRAVSECVLSATRYVKKVLFYEVPTTRNFEPDIFVDITKTMDKKEKLLRMHASQIKKTRIPNLSIIESAKSCAIFRGYQGRVKYAEGFRSLRYMLDV